MVKCLTTSESRFRHPPTKTKILHEILDTLFDSESQVGDAVPETQDKDTAVLDVNENDLFDLARSEYEQDPPLAGTNAQELMPQLSDPVTSQKSGHRRMSVRHLKTRLRPNAIKASNYESPAASDDVGFVTSKKRRREELKLEEEGPRAMKLQGVAISEKELNRGLEEDEHEEKQDEAEELEQGVELQTEKRKDTANRQGAEGEKFKGLGQIGTVRVTRT